MGGVVWENGWRWIFILVSYLRRSLLQVRVWLTGRQEGIVTCIVAIAAFKFIHNYPNTSFFLSDDERAFIHQRLAADSDATNEEKFSWGAVVEALKDVNCWLYGFGFHTMSLPLYTLSLFLVRHAFQRPSLGASSPMDSVEITDTTASRPLSPAWATQRRRPNCLPCPRTRSPSSRPF